MRELEDTHVTVVTLKQMHSLVYLLTQECMLVERESSQCESTLVGNV